MQADTKAFTTRILFDNNRAIGVEYHHENQIRRVRATKEVILSGGAINSPQMLMVSGVGDGDQLKKLGIPVVAHLPGVGENLQDHLEMYIQHVSDGLLEFERLTQLKILLLLADSRELLCLVN